MNLFSALTSKIFGAASLALLILLAVTTIDRNQWRAAAIKADAALAKVKDAQKTATAIAKRLLAEQEARYKEHANEADTQHADELARAQTDADRYLAANRVPSACAGGAARPTAAAPASGGAGVPASLPGVALVADADVQACTAAATYALDAREWALGLDRATVSSVQGVKP